MNLIKDRDARTKKRQKAKEKFDKNITLSVINDSKDKKFKFAANANGDTVRLLDEGAIVTASGDLDLYIKKGTIQKFYNGANKYLDNLTNSYEGTINIGHNDFATFPFIVGTWKKSDLTVVNNGEGRHGLDVDLHLNSAHPLVQALRVQDIPVGVSVEMYLNFDEEASEKEQIPIVDEIFIADFAIVGECGNVGSSGSVDLQGVKMNKPVEDIEAVIEHDAELEEVAEENEMPEDVENTEETEEVEEVETEEPEETAEEEETEENESVEEEIVEETEEVEETEGEEDEDEEDALAVAEETIESLKAENEALKAQIEALKKSNNKKDRKIKEHAEKNAEFAKKFKGLSVSMGVTKEVKEVPHTLYSTGDGIGE